VQAYHLHTSFSYSLQNEFREYIGPRNVNRFPRFSSFDLQVTRPVTLHVGEKSLHAGVGDHFNPRDVQNNFVSARFGEFFDTFWREYRAKFVLGLCE
jgi:hypothetical protein